MPTQDEAALLVEATHGVLAEHGPHRGDWPQSVRVQEVDADIEDDRLVVSIRYSDARYPDERLGAAFEVDEIFWTENDGVLDAAWAATHAYVYFCEATSAGGDPLGWSPADDGVRWYRAAGTHTGRTRR